jgi:hypothetical protein
MVNAGAIQDIVDYFRRFIDLHFEVLRRRQTEAKYLSSLQNKERHDFADIPDKLLKHDDKHSRHDHAPTSPGQLH